ncbi:MAG: hypothetical protein ACE5FI_03920 [Anaerolineales bacterium]
MLRTSFHAVSCHLQIIGWNQVYFAVWHGRRLKRWWHEVQPVVGPAARDGLLFFGVGAGVGFVAALVGALVLPAGGA